MKHLIIPTLMMLISSCGSENEQFNIDTHIDISLRDGDGNDLLNPENANAFKDDQIKIFYALDGNQILVNDGNLDYPRGFLIYEHEGVFRMRLFPNTNRREEAPVTYVNWSSSDTDTIKCSIERKDNSEICIKVWVNDNLAWQAYENERLIEIVK